MKVEVIASTEKIKQYNLNGAELVAIDVLRATSTMTTALQNGAKKIIPVLHVKDALKIKRKNKSVLLGGERGGIKIEGFDFGNSPYEYTPEKVNGRILVITTSNGTRLIQNSLTASTIYLGSLINARAVAEKLQQNQVLLACSGTKGYFSPEDFLGAGAIIFYLLKIRDITLGENAEKALKLFNLVDNRKDFIKLFPHGRRLVERGYEKDLTYCLEVDKTEVVPKFYCGGLYR